MLNRKIMVNNFQVRELLTVKDILNNDHDSFEC